MIPLADVTYKYRILQSPMCGCSDLPFRQIARELGCEMAFCEMVKDDSVVRTNRKTNELLATAPHDHPLGMQLIGREPDTMAEAARCLAAQGADEINVNLGCPVPKVVKNGCGAALLREPQLVGRILAAMIRAVRVPVTVKMRSGFDSAEDDSFLEIARIAAGAGVAAITVHGRTRTQLYTGYSNLNAIRAVVEAVDVPVIGNGDLRSGADVARMVRETGCAAVMLARGALGYPWIYREAAAALAGEPAPEPPTVSERVAMIERHFALGRERYGDGGACIRIRKVIGWYTLGLSHAAELRSKGNVVASPEAFRAVIDRLRECNAPDARPPRLVTPNARPAAAAPVAGSACATACDFPDVIDA